MDSDAPRLRARLLGPTGLRVSELCLGAMMFGDSDRGGRAAPREQTERILDRYLDAGGNFVDTANVYAGGASEELLGELLGARRERVVLATKYTAVTHPGDPNGGGNHRRSLVRSLEASLRRLRTDYVDLLWVHAWDGVTPIEETMRALDDVVRAGKVLYIGVSDMPAWLVARANTLAELRGQTPFAAIQVEYSLVERTVERELTPMARALGLSVLAWAPLAGGLLTGKYTAGDTAANGRLAPGDRRLSERNLAIAAAVDALAGELGATPAQVALAWLRERRGADVIPIIGTRTAEQLTEALGCLALELPADALRRLDELTAPSLGFPHEMLQRVWRASRAS